jgi:hypothetical protein
MNLCGGRVTGERGQSGPGGGRGGGKGWCGRRHRQRTEGQEGQDEHKYKVHEDINTTELILHKLKRENQRIQGSSTSY